MPSSQGAARGLGLLRRSLARSGGELLRGALGTLLLRGGFAFLTFVATVILARRLGAGGYGTFAWASAWLSVLQVMTTFGVDVLSIREFAAHKARAAWPAMHGLLRTAPQAVLIGSTAAALLAMLAGGLLLAGSERSTFMIAVALVPVLALSAIRQGAIQGLGAVTSARLPEDLVRPAGFIVLLLLAWDLLGLRQTPFSAMALQGVAVLASFAVGLAILRRILPPRGGVAAARLPVGRLLRIALPLGVLNGIGIVLAQIDTILLGLLRDSTQVGLYATATRVASVVGIAEFAVNAAYLPVVARLSATGRLDRLKAGAPLVTLGALALSSILALPFIVFAHQILALFGSSFTSGAFILRVLCVTFLLSATAGQNGALLMMTEHVRPVVIGGAVALATNVVLNLILIPDHGARGAALAWLLSVLVWNGFLSVQVRRIHGFTATPLALIPLLRDRLLRRSG